MGAMGSTLTFPVPMAGDLSCDSATCDVLAQLSPLVPVSDVGRAFLELDVAPCDTGRS